VSHVLGDPESPAPMVSIMVPTLNGGITLPALFRALRADPTPLPFEIVVVDSGSTDGTLDLARANVDQIIQIEPGTFDHGTSRNRGIEAARGPFVVCLVQDALPTPGPWLQELVAPLMERETVAGTWARQLPANGASAIVRHYMERSAITSDRSEINRLSPGELDRLSPLERLQRCRFDNVCACIRKSVWRDIPFRPTPIAEDLAWAKEVLLAGFALEYRPGAVVVHSHDRSAMYEYRRTRMLHRQLAALFGIETIPTVGTLMRVIAGALGVHQHLGGTKVATWCRATALAFAWPIGQYLGARDHRQNRRPYRPAGV
jgi:rhamnosyltransferase